MWQSAPRPLKKCVTVRHTQTQLCTTRRGLSFPFLSFPFLSFPFLSFPFPFLSFPFLSFLSSVTHTSAAQRSAHCVTVSVCSRAQPCLKFSVALAPPSAVLRLASSSWSILARTDGVFCHVRLPRRVERSSSQDRLFEAELRGHLLEAAWYGFTGTQWYVLWSYSFITQSSPLFFFPSSSSTCAPSSSRWSSSLSLRGSNRSCRCQG